MKVILFATVIAIAVTASYAIFCRSNGECPEGQCCAGVMPFRGTCKAMTTEGQKCLVGDKTFPFNDIHILSCPCADGLDCVSTATATTKKGKKDNGMCQAPTTEAPETTTAEDGGSGEHTNEPTEVTGDHEVTHNQSNETTDDGSNEATKDASHEETKDVDENASQEPSEAPLE